jgi:hypothetical protein
MSKLNPRLFALVTMLVLVASTAGFALPWWGGWRW